MTRSFRRVTSLLAGAAVLAPVALLTVAGPATAMPQEGTRGALTTTAQPVVAGSVAEATPLLERSESMSYEQWISISPFHGLSLSQQAQYYQNGQRMRALLAKMKVGTAVVHRGSTRWDASNWQEFKAWLDSGVNYQQTGLPQWYDRDRTNDGFLSPDPDEVWLTVTDNPNFDPATEYSRGLGYNPNYFASAEAQDAFIAAEGLILNRRPFDHATYPTPDGYSIYQTLQAGLFMYSDGNTPAPTSGGWAESWDRVKPTGFDPSKGTSPLAPRR